MVDAERLKAAIGISEEWLISGEIMRPFPLRRYELDVSKSGPTVNIGFPDDAGYQTRRLNDFTFEGTEILLDLAGDRYFDAEKLILSKRVSNDELADSIAESRALAANEAAEKFKKHVKGTDFRLSFRPDKDRIALISAGVHGAVVDVTASISAEEMVAFAIDKKRRAGKGKSETLSIIAECKKADEIARLLELIKVEFRDGIGVLTDGKNGELMRVKPDPLAEMLNQKPKRAGLTVYRQPGKTAASLIALDRKNIDVISAKNGETVRFKGLPFARIRKIAGKEAVWLGVNDQKRVQKETFVRDAEVLLSELKAYRNQTNDNNRHDFYKTASEAWLEFELRQNITRLDANLMLSPLYGQFRASGDRIDLLGLRSDGRLVIIEVKTSADRQVALQAADYWRKIETLRRTGILAKANLFGSNQIADKPAIVYLVSPALEMPHDLNDLMGMVIPEIEMWNFALHRDWRCGIRVLGRECYSSALGITNR